MAGNGNEKMVSLTLIVDKQASKVVFAEAENEFVEFISQIRSFPLSTVAKLLNAQPTVEATSTNASNSVAKPVSPDVLLLSVLENVSSSCYPQGVVKEAAVAYMVMDNLEVKPMSISLIKPYIKDFNGFEERIVQVGPQEALAILKASFQTNAVLTTVFLGKKVEVLKASPPSVFRKLLYLLLLLFFLGCVGVVAEILEKNMKKSQKSWK